MGSVLAFTLIFFLKAKTSTSYFSLSGTKFHIIGTKFEKLSAPCYTDLMLGFAKKEL